MSGPLTPEQQTVAEALSREAIGTSLGEPSALGFSDDARDKGVTLHFRGSEDWNSVKLSAQDVRDYITASITWGVEGSFDGDTGYSAGPLTNEHPLVEIVDEWPGSGYRTWKVVAKVTGTYVGRLETGVSIRWLSPLDQFPPGSYDTPYGSTHGTYNLIEGQDVRQLGSNLSGYRTSAVRIKWTPDSGVPDGSGGPSDPVSVEYTNEQVAMVVLDPANPTSMAFSTTSVAPCDGPTAYETPSGAWVVGCPPPFVEPSIFCCRERVMP